MEGKKQLICLLEEMKEKLDLIQVMTEAIQISFEYANKNSGDEI